MHTHPAVLIGGPPHSGKSVLLYALSQALRARGIEHYALRSCPDYEGDFSQEAKPDAVRAVRIKGAWTTEWVDLICRDIRRRHLPLLVDIGGRPTPDQERIFDECTHAILLTKDDASHAEWSERIARHGLPLLADLTSLPEGESVVQSSAPLLQGVVAGLKRHATVANPLVDALTELLAGLFATERSELRRRHLQAAPVELAVDLDRLAVTLGWAQPGAKVTWRPEHLPHLLDYLPAAIPLAIYGRGTNWIHAALARLAFPAAYYSFDVRLGWVQARLLPRAQMAQIAPDEKAPLCFHLASGADWLHVEGLLPSSYIDISDLDALSAPIVPPDTGVILSGKLPYWLVTSLAITYADAPWLAVYQLQLQGAVVVYSRDRLRLPGSLLRLAGPATEGQA